MNIIESITLFAIMAALAALPGASVALVVVRSATLGIGNGLAVTAGILLGDLVFILLAVLGLSAIAQALGGLFLIIRYLGAAYLIWLGFTLFRTTGATRSGANRSAGAGGLLTSFLAGFFLTLGDIKAILFYVSLFPVFIEVSALRLADVLMVMSITIVSVGGVKVIYALAAARIAARAGGFAYENAARKLAGGCLVGAGGYILAKT